MTLPDHMSCGNDMPSLINATYSWLLARNQNQLLPDQYFLDRIILAPRNVQVYEINSTILNSVASEEKITYFSADSVTDAEYDYVQPEVLHTLNPSGFPLHQLELKNGVPLMLLCNLDPIHGLYNGTCLRLIRSTRQILECHVLSEEGNANANNVVFIPHMALDSGIEDSPVPFCRLQFPVHLAYEMTINKSQGQTLKHVGFNLSSPIFSHGQLYVALYIVLILETLKFSFLMTKIPQLQM